MPTKMLTEKGSAEMLIVAYDYEGVLAHPVAPGTTVNAVYYKNFLEHHLHHNACG